MRILSSEKEECRISCSTAPNQKYRRPLMSRFSAKTAPYRDRYHETTKKPQFASALIAERERMAKI